jgi:hypothetical protein
MQQLLGKDKLWSPVIKRGTKRVASLVNNERAAREADAVFADHYHLSFLSSSSSFYGNKHGCSSSTGSSLVVVAEDSSAA